MATGIHLFKVYKTYYQNETKVQLKLPTGSFCIVLYWTAVFIAEVHTSICIALRKVHFCKIWTYSIRCTCWSSYSQIILPRSQLYISRITTLTIRLLQMTISSRFGIYFSICNFYKKKKKNRQRFSVNIFTMYCCVLIQILRKSNLYAKEKFEDTNEVNKNKNP